MPASEPASDELPLSLPAWLPARLEPWSVVAARVDRAGGVRLRLRSPRAELPVRLTLVGQRPRVDMLDARVPARAAASFVRALMARLGPERRLRPWLEGLQQLAKGLPAAPGDPLASWRAWPTRPCKPHLQIAALPQPELEGLPRSVRAALCLYTFARAQLLAGLCEWEALGELPPDPSFVELHLELVARALLGQRGEALALTQRAEQRAASSAQAWTALARAYEQLGEVEAALRAHTRVIELRGELWDHLRMARTRGSFGEAVALEPASLPSDEARLSFARAAAKILRGAGRYDELLARLRAVLGGLEQAPPADLVCLCARLHLWRGQLEEARARLATLAPEQQRSAVALELEAIAALLEGRAAAGLAGLLAAEQAEGDTGLERLLWRAEGLLANDELDAALASIDAHILRENSLAAYLLKLHVLARREDPEAFAHSLNSPTFLDGLVREVLPSLCDAAELEAAQADPPRFAELTRSILADMGGNRSAEATWCRGEHSPAPLCPVPLRVSGRDASVAVLVGIRHTPPDELLARFEPVAADYPRSPHPFTYRGELLIWLGRYDEALACFAAGDERAPTRWSFVGRAATYELLGETEQAERWAREGIERFGELEGATTNVYRGERLRLHGQLEAAQRDLDIALRAKPRRIGARMNLALIHHARGEQQAWARELERLRADAPAFLFEAGVREGVEIGPEDLTRCLELMVGNRSSFLHSLIDAHGAFRVVPPPQQWIAQARLCLADYRELLGEALVARWLSAQEGEL